MCFRPDPLFDTSVVFHVCFPTSRGVFQRRQMSFVEAGDMASFETAQLASVETERSQLSQLTHSRKLSAGQLETQCSIWTGWPDGCSGLAGWSFPTAVSGWGAHCCPTGFPVDLAKIIQNLSKITPNHQKSTC